MPHITCHTFRHTFCTRLCEVEPNIKTIQELMGHADVSMTMNVYADATAEMTEKAMEKMMEKMGGLFEL